MSGFRKVKVTSSVLNGRKQFLPEVFNFIHALSKLASLWVAFSNNVVANGENSVDVRLVAVDLISESLVFLL